ncbi:hypothetical protein SAE02_74760 [Skermanella aerolata]|uniref:Uncharacterized protein n=1 Tax=Skermanella aerolata TaxID=393310 RepID=A0A512E3N9_9PROT|nr:hypothetical protein SAE02_74760 [Skermanella aerolata]
MLWMIEIIQRQAIGCLAGVGVNSCPRTAPSLRAAGAVLRELLTLESRRIGRFVGSNLGRRQRRVCCVWEVTDAVQSAGVER